MITYGLNRPLNSFGLSYPGYWFIIVDDVGLSTPFIAYGTREYIAYELARLFPAHEITMYVAKRSGVIVVNRNFHALETRWFDATTMLRYMEAIEVSRILNTSVDIREFIAKRSATFKVSASNRAFIAQVNREFEL